MPDWKVGEFEGKFKDEFAQSNNRIIQNQGNEHGNGAGALNITSKKLKHGDGNEKSPQGVISETNNAESQECDSEHIQSSNGIPSQDTNFADEGIRHCNLESDAIALRARGSVSEARDPTENSNSCHFTLSDGSPVVNNHSVPQSGFGYGDNDLPYIDWPGIDNFEDVDTLFRKCDSTYGQQQLETTDELSWLPSSSDAIYSSSDALHPGFESSYLEYGILDDLSSYHCPEDKLFPTTNPEVAVCDKQFNDNYPFGEERDVNVYSKQADQGDAMELLPIDQTCNGHGIDGYENIDMVRSQYSLENSMEQLADQKFSVASASELSPSKNLLKQKDCLDATSASYVTSRSNAESNCHFSLPGASFTERNSKVQKKATKLRQKQLISDNNLAAGHPSHQTLARRTSQPGQNYDIEKTGLGKRSLEIPKAVTDSSMVVDSSFVSTISSDNSLEETSFRQLQHAVNQLDVKTKLCIRDGLYRLARSAQHRQGFPNTANSNGEGQDAKDLQNAEASAKFVEPVNIETQTNPIDRSIALLLFHQPSDRVNGAVDDASSLKSHVGNQHHQIPTENQGLVSATPIYSPRGPSGSINAKSRKNY